MYYVTEVIDEDKLDFTLEGIRTHSMRSRVVIVVFLDNIPIFLIMLVDC